MKINAKWVSCADHMGHGETEGEHSYRDNCYGCAPFWWMIPVCPKVHLHTTSGSTLSVKLKPSGYCRLCKKFYNIKRGMNWSEKEVHKAIGRQDLKMPDYINRLD